MNDITKKFKIYLITNDKTVKSFAEELSVSPRYLCHIMTGQCYPSIRLAKEIARLTNGEISYLPEALIFHKMSQARVTAESQLTHVATN